MKCNRCGKWAGAHATLPGQPTDHLCMCAPQATLCSKAKQHVRCNDGLGLRAGGEMMGPTTFENCKAYEFEPAVQERVNLVVAAKVAAERERCAKVCEYLKVGFHSYFEIDERLQECADAIRAA